MIDKCVDGVPYLVFPKLSQIPGVHHAVFTRRGGESSGPFQSLNVSYLGGDIRSAVDKNRRAVGRVMAGMDLTYIRQVHGIGVVVDSQTKTVNAGAETAELPLGDAVISNRLGAAFVIQTADCQSVLLFDPVKRVVANIHSGWRGSVQNIIGHTLSRMAADFGCRGKDILAAIGPSLGPCCAEFIHYRQEIPGSLWHYHIGDNRFDFWAMSRDQLAEAGVPSENIEISNLCTRCRTDLFFSYRAEKITGRFAVAIGLER